MTQPKMTIDRGGTTRWRLPDGTLHREDGPAVEWANGSRKWCQNGLLHREDGPAVVFWDGRKGWWIRGAPLDAYYPNFGCFEPASRAEALARLNSKPRPYSRELYLADIDRMFPEGEK